MELRDVLQQMMQESQLAGQPTDLKIGTVSKIDPLEITTNTQMAPLRSSVLLLTEAVMEKKIPILKHTHTVKVSDTYSGGGSATCSTELKDIVCQEAGAELPADEKYITLNKGLAVGDEVILLRVQNGQRFIVLSRVFKGG